MKPTLTAFAFIVALASTGLAGSFGGPAPFRNGSPLPTGTDGTYQAVANGTNLSGIFSFQISNGVQTNPNSSTSSYLNSWVFFVDGNILRGETYANVSGSKVSGILDAQTSDSIPTNEDGSVALPIVYALPGDSASGDFSGKINQKSPSGSFSGDGNMTGTPGRTDQIVAISENALGVITVNVVSVTVPGSTLTDTEFTFRGTRLNTSGSASSTSGTSTP